MPLIATIRNMVRIIDCFNESNIELGVTEIARRLEMNTSTVHHLITTLCHERLLQKTDGNKYKLGFKLLEWGSSVMNQNEISHVAAPFMSDLMEKVNETVHLGVYDRESNEIVYLQKFECRQSMRMATKIGGRQPVHCTGLGKVLLAYSNQTVIENVIQRGLPKRTANTITDEKSYLNELHRIRQQGYAIDNEESELGIFCIAAPIFDFTGKATAAVSVSGPAFRLNNSHLPKVISLVKNTASSISKEMGGFIGRGRGSFTET